MDRNKQNLDFNSNIILEEDNFNSVDFMVETMNLVNNIKVASIFVEVFGSIICLLVNERYSLIELVTVIKVHNNYTLIKINYYTPLSLAYLIESLNLVKAGMFIFITEMDHIQDL